MLIESRQAIRTILCSMEFKEDSTTLLLLWLPQDGAADGIQYPGGKDHWPRRIQDKQHSGWSYLFPCSYCPPPPSPLPLLCFKQLNTGTSLMPRLRPLEREHLVSGAHIQQKFECTNSNAVFLIRLSEIKNAIFLLVC